MRREKITESDPTMTIYILAFRLCLQLKTMLMRVVVVFVVLNLVLLDLCSWCSGTVNSKYMCCLSCE